MGISEGVRGVIWGSFWGNTGVISGPYLVGGEGD